MLHDDNSTLDGVIAGISPRDDNGDRLYHDTAEFAVELIKGTPDEGSPYGYAGDAESLGFVTNYLYCEIATSMNTGVKPSGSIMFDFYSEYVMQLDPDRLGSSEFYRIVESNTFVKSSVKSHTTAIGGGTSYSSNATYVGEGGQAGSIAKAVSWEADGPDAEAEHEATADSDAEVKTEESQHDAAGDAGNADSNGSAIRLAEKPLAA